MGARPDIRLSWSFLRALTEMWVAHPGTYKVEDEADDLVPALAQMCIKALAAEVRETVSQSGQAQPIAGELTQPSGTRTAVTVRDIANKVIHGSPERVVVLDGDIRLYFVNSQNEVAQGRWTEIWFSASGFIEALHQLLHIRPHDSESRDEAVRGFIRGLGASRLLPSRVTSADS
jgi:hypothetical protein